MPVGVHTTAELENSAGPIDVDVRSGVANQLIVVNTMSYIIGSTTPPTAVASPTGGGGVWVEVANLTASDTLSYYRRGHDVLLGVETTQCAVRNQAWYSRPVSPGIKSLNLGSSAFFTYHTIASLFNADYHDTETADTYVDSVLHSKQGSLVLMGSAIVSCPNTQSNLYGSSRLETYSGASSIFPSYGWLLCNAHTGLYGSTKWRTRIGRSLSPDLDYVYELYTDLFIAASVSHSINSVECTG